MRSALLLAVCLLVASVAAASPYPFPGKVTPVPCTGCEDDNADLPTYPYNDPLIDHTGRYVDSATTINEQHMGMRTVRAQKVRVSPATGRLYIELGETLTAYPLDQFFTTILRQPMPLVSVMNTGSPYTRGPMERIAAPASFLYPEATTSGWQIYLIDAQVTMTDFDADDRGYVYYGSLYWGWGIGRDVDVQYGKHMTFVSQTQDGIEPQVLFTLKSGDLYLAVVSNARTTSSGSTKIYNVTNPAVPSLQTTRSGSAESIRLWDRYEAGQRIAVVHGDQHLRVWDYAAYLAGGAPLADYVPSGGRTISGLAFDDSGTLWFTERATSNTITLLQKLTPGENGYTLSSSDVLGTFVTGDITAGAGYLAITGRAEGVPELRLFRVIGGSPTAVNTDNFFRKYYHKAPLGYASPNNFVKSYISQSDVKLVEHADKTYLFYSVEGLGDVFELERSTVAPDRIATSIALTTSPNPSSGAQTVTITATVTANAAGSTPAGLVTFTRNGVAYGSAGLVAGLGNTYTATLFRTDLNLGVHELTASFEGDDDYLPSGHAAHTHEGAVVAPVISAAANGTSSISVNWAPMTNVEYDVLRATTMAGPFQSLGLVTGGIFNDADVAAGTTYLYKVQALNPDDSPGPISNLDVATTVAFSDAGLPAGTKVKAAHFTELRTAVQALRTAAGLSAATFTDPTLSAGMVVKGVHYTELRTAANQARTALGLSTLPTTAVTTILRTNVTGLRDAIN